MKRTYGTGSVEKWRGKFRAWLRTETGRIALGSFDTSVGNDV